MHFVFSSVQLGAVFIHLQLLQTKLHRKHEICVMVKWFPIMPIMLGHICFLITSVTELCVQEKVAITVENYSKIEKTGDFCLIFKHAILYLYSFHTNVSKNSTCRVHLCMNLQSFLSSSHIIWGCFCTPGMCCCHMASPPCAHCRHSSCGACRY